MEFTITALNGYSVKVESENWMTAMGKALAFFDIEISSIAMSGYYAQEFGVRPYEQPLKDCIATMKLLGVKTAFLPLGVSEVSERPWLYNETVERLKRVGEWAAEAGVVIGFETMIKAEGQCKMLDDIGRFVADWLPEFARDNRSYLTVAIGCTGGQHRSVYFAEALAARFRGQAQVLVRHREIKA